MSDRKNFPRGVLRTSLNLPLHNSIELLVHRVELLVLCVFLRLWMIDWLKIVTCCKLSCLVEKISAEWIAERNVFRKYSEAMIYTRHSSHVHKEITVWPSGLCTLLSLFNELALSK